MAGRWSPRTTRCRRSGNTPCWSPATAIEVLTLGAPSARADSREGRLMVSMQQASLDEEERAGDRSRCPPGRCSTGCRNCWRTGVLARSLPRADQQERRPNCSERFPAEETVEVLVRARALFIDAMLRAIWQQLLQPELAPAIGAAGGRRLRPRRTASAFRRRHPDPGPGRSRRCPPRERAQVGTLITFLWDIGLEVGHSVRTVAECAEESAADVGVMTTLLEARLLAGIRRAAGRDARCAGARTRLAVGPLLRSQARRNSANGTSRPTTPPTTSSPTSRPARAACATCRPSAGWPSGTSAPRASTNWCTKGFLTPAELRKLKQAQSFLWKVRFGLHVLTGRHEDRLLFDHQIRLATTFGYEDATYTLAVEQLMQRYYRTVMDVSFLNELLLQVFRDAILPGDTPPQPLNARFQIRNDYLEAVSDGRVRAHARRRCWSCSCCCSRTRRCAASAPAPCARSRATCG